MTEPEPVRKSQLPTTPPPEWEITTVGGKGSAVVRRRVTFGDWEPVLPDHWADEPDPGIRDAARHASGQQTEPTAADAQAMLRRMHAAAGLPAPSSAGDCPNCDHPFLLNGCTCRPWTVQGGVPRWCTGEDTVDMISGYERGKDCPHHRPVDAEPDPTTADDPVPLRWGHGDVLHGDDDTVIVCLSGPNREPYWLELEPERAAALRDDLTPPAAEQDDNQLAAAPLTAAERKFLHFALDEAAEEMSYGDGFTDEDQATLDSLRRRAGKDER
jgi:hypothetical protein